MTATYEIQADLHTDIRSQSEEELKKELEYWVNRIKQICKNISVSVVRFIDGEFVEMPLLRQVDDQKDGIERIEAIVQELKNRMIP